MFDSHLSTYGNLCLVEAALRVLCPFIMNVWSLCIAPSCVAVGELASQLGVAWAMCIWGVGDGFKFLLVYHH